VPPEQRPLEEYRQLLASWFFRWPTGAPAGLARALAGSWLLALGPCLLVASGSLALRRAPLQLGLAGASAALLLPLLLLLRQWLGWRYVQARLLAERVDYEESGWYDGQVWEKPISWRLQDRLVASHEVAPVMGRLVRAIAATLGLLIAGAGLCQAL
jgi:hypothetical protein